MKHHTDFILIACTDPVVTPEAAHAAAATRREVIHVTDPRDLSRYALDAAAVIVDASTAAHVAATGRRSRIYFVAPEPGPIDYEMALRSHAEQAFILPAESTQLLQALAADSTEQHHAAALRITVVGASGGVGASTLAAAIARMACAEQGTALLIDAIPLSGGLDLLMGLEAAPGARWPDISLGTGAIDATDIAAALPSTPDGITVLSAARAKVETPFTLESEAVGRLISATSGGFDVLVVDAPPTNIPQASDLVVVVCAAEVRSSAAAAEICAELKARGSNFVVALRHRGWSGLSARDIERITQGDVSVEISHIKSLTKTTEVAGLPTALPKKLAAPALELLAVAGW